MRGTLFTAIACAVTLASLAPIARADDDAPPSTEEKGRPVDKGVFGIGLVFGEPTGISAKIYLADDKAVQIAAGSAFIGGGLQAHGDFLLHPWILQDRDSFVLPLYLGPGVRVIQYDGGRSGDDHYAIGMRGVLGMLFDFKEVPIDVFVEIAGVLEYDFKDTEGVEGAINAGAGVRYYF